MKISLTIPDVNACPSARPRACPYCEKSFLHRHGTVLKPLKDHHVREVEVDRYKGLSCARTFRYYPSGVRRKQPS
jgi:hypothetical protein